MNAKPLFVVIAFLCVIALFAGGAIGDTDLTPDSPSAQSRQGDVGLSVLAGQNSVGSANGLPNSGRTSGTCADVYTVRSGDTLSRIARDCNVSLKALIAVNPQIVNPNLIHIDQKINLVGAAPAVVEAQPPAPVVLAPTAAPVLPTAPVAPTNAPAAQVPPAPAADPARVPMVKVMVPPAAPPAVAGGGGAAAFNAGTNADINNMSAGALGIRPGGTVSIVLTGFPANTLLDISAGPSGMPPQTQINQQTTDSAGALTVLMQIPANAQPGQAWMVNAITQSAPPVAASSDVFLMWQ